MSVGLRLTAEEYDRMIARGAFDGINRRIEMIRGELREMNPAGPVHEDYVDFLNRWSNKVTTSEDCVVRIQSSISGKSWVSRFCKRYSWSRRFVKDWR